MGLSPPSYAEMKAIRFDSPQTKSSGSASPTHRSVAAAASGWAASVVAERRSPRERVSARPRRIRVNRTPPDQTSLRPCGAIAGSSCPPDPGALLAEHEDLTEGCQSVRPRTHGGHSRSGRPEAKE